MEQLLDVSDLEPCEPLQQSLEAVRGLDAGDYLLLIHRREPHPLFEMLEQMGFRWHSRANGDSRYEIFIWRADDPVAEQTAQRRIDA